MKTIHFPRWAEVLSASDLSPELRESYKVTIRWYLSWCHRRGVGCSVESARNFVDWAVAEKGPKEWVVERWREAIRWFFLGAKAQVGVEGTACSEAESGNVGKFEGVKVECAHRDGAALPVGVGHDLERRDLAGEERIEAATGDEAKILAVMRRLGRALRTERNYVGWYRDFVRQSGLADGCLMSASMIKGYLDYLAMERAVSSSTQKQALNALVFIAQEVFELELGEIGEFVRAKNRKRIPVVMSKEETRQFFAKLKGERLLMAQVQYAAGLRVSELCRLRVQDLDLQRNQVVVRSGKGGKDRIAPLSERLVESLGLHLQDVRVLFEADLERADLSGVYLPEALARRQKACFSHF